MLDQFFRPIVSRYLSSIGCFDFLPLGGVRFISAKWQCLSLTTDDTAFFDSEPKPENPLIVVIKLLSGE